MGNLAYLFTNKRLRPPPIPANTMQGAMLTAFVFALTLVTLTNAQTVASAGGDDYESGCDENSCGDGQFCEDPQALASPTCSPCGGDYDCCGSAVSVGACPCDCGDYEYEYGDYT